MGSKRSFWFRRVVALGPAGAKYVPVEGTRYWQIAEVVHGQQRLMSLRYFYDGIWEPTKREFALRGVEKDFEGKTYKTLRDEDRLAKSDDAILHVTVFKQDEPSDGSPSGVYQGVREIELGRQAPHGEKMKCAVHHSGGMRELLRKLNELPDWREIYGPEDDRMRDQELILRFLAFYYDADAYKSPLVSFLNAFMGRYRILEATKAGEMQTVFSSAIHIVHDAIGKSAFRLQSAQRRRIRRGNGRACEEVGERSSGRPRCV